FAQATIGLDLPAPVTGGANRQDSCRMGIEACHGTHPQRVLIHDAARPFISHAVISNVIAELDHCDAVIPGLPVADTMKFAPEGFIERTVDRGSMWFVQTPQGFAYDKILSAHRQAARDGRDSFTDDAAVAEYAGLQVRIAAGDQANRKLTTSHDVRVADRELPPACLSNAPMCAPDKVSIFMCSKRVMASRSAASRFPIPPNSRATPMPMQHSTH
ncbi:MAG: 2-C-methyl-D-erythritol 4-phosphate cytidylyltransferase, partial [Phyllobacteriaceae bacterium]|nr:2-C-methyl-D-erythritol 4-phosphate cytidylyltransferase [Phyllobacteriaceae bacterium]